MNKQMYFHISKRSAILMITCLWFAAPMLSQVPFSRGVNLTSWFQVNSPGEIQFTRFTRNDLADIKSLGFDVVRLPINMHSMTSGDPSYILDPLYFSFLDSVVNWCEQLHLYLILDNHSFDPNISTTPDIEAILIKVWPQMAFHYKDRSDYIIYEILNEPHGISTSSWGAIQGRVINAIRAADKNHMIIVGGSGYNTYTELNNLPYYTDLNLLYTFHFYDPFMFTHQGASWTDPSMVPLAGVPFPYNPAEMPSCPASLKGTWIENSLNSYPANGNVNNVKQLIDNAVNFRSSRGVNVFCGEFGVYIPNSDNADRCYWYKVVSDYLEEKNIPWTIWDYKGGFGLFKKGTNELFEHDLNTVLLDSLGLNVPAQTPFVVKPDSAGFMIYTDYIGEKTLNSSYSNGAIDFYSGNLPSNGRYCLSWDGFSQYNALGFDFVPDKDMTRIVSENFALDFMVRGSEPGIKFEIRFRDSKTGAGDHPWRMGTTIDADDASWDRKWHHVRIPLASFNERGAWDDGIWYNPEGKYDWSKVDKLEISTEWTDIIGRKVWFDNIHISDVDTAIVRVDEALGIQEHPGYGMLKMKIAPNPVRDHTKISFAQTSEGQVIITIFTLTGIKIRTITDYDQCPGPLSFDWDCRSDDGSVVQPGIYICQITASGYTGSGMLIKL